MLLRPAVGEREHRATDAFAIATFGHRNIRDMAVPVLGKKIQGLLQMQKSDQFAVVVFGDEQERSGGLLGKMSRDIAIDAVYAIALVAPWRQIEFDEPFDQTEDKRIVIRLREAHMNFVIAHASLWSLPENLMLLRYALPVLQCIVSPCTLALMQPATLLPLHPTCEGLYARHPSEGWDDGNFQGFCDSGVFRFKRFKNAYPTENCSSGMSMRLALPARIIAT